MRPTAGSLPVRPAADGHTPHHPPRRQVDDDKLATPLVRHVRGAEGGRRTRCGRAASQRRRRRGSCRGLHAEHPRELAAQVLERRLGVALQVEERLPVRDLLRPLRLRLRELGPDAVPVPRPQPLSPGLLEPQQRAEVELFVRRCGHWLHGVRAAPGSNTTSPPASLARKRRISKIHGSLQQTRGVDGPRRKRGMRRVQPDPRVNALAASLAAGCNFSERKLGMPA